MANNLTNAPAKKLPFSVALRSDAYQTMINNTLQEPKRRANFVANISSAVANNPQLQNCTAQTIISAGLMAESLNLPLAQSLGYAHLVPYGDKCQLIIGYKGYIQLAYRSGEYVYLNALPVYDGEFLGYDEFTAEPKFKFLTNRDEIDSSPIGYMAGFELRSGARKVIYMSKKAVEKHGRRYSKAYNSFWGKDQESFDNQALKTVLRQLLSRWGIMTTDLQTAYVKDMGVLDGEKVEYVDSPSNNLEAPTTDTPAQTENDVIEQLNS